MINPSQKIWTPLNPPELDWRDHVPVSRVTGDIYFSTVDGLSESQYVFVEGNHLPERWHDNNDKQPFVIGEIGFGSGLTACLTLETWRQHRPANRQLHYLAVEQSPLSPQDMRRALAPWPSLTPALSGLLDHWPDPLPGCHRRYFPDWGVTVDFWWGDANEILSDLASHGRQWVDAWYLDGFSPSTGLGPWSTEVYAGMAALSKPQATVATFSVARDVREGLSEAGFTTEKRPGFAGKRDTLSGTLCRSVLAPVCLTPWDLNPAPQHYHHALVVGAGLAGAHTAYALASRGIEVTVLEADVCAGGGSSNLQGVTYTRLSHRHNPLSDFSIAAFSYATDHYRRLHRSGALRDNLDIGWGGYIQLHDTDETLEHLASVLGLAPDFARILSADEISDIIGMQPRCGGIHYLRGGWLDPRAVCRSLLAHPLITLREQCGPVQLRQLSNDAWQASNTSGEVLCEAPLAVLATAQAALTEPGLEWLPLTVIRGQTTHLPTSEMLSQLPITLCDQGYLPPARQGIHCTGASFGPGDAQTDERATEHGHNIGMLQQALPKLDLTLGDNPWQGHVALRCNSNDYLPIAGLVPALDIFNERYDRIRHDRKQIIDAPTPVRPGLAVLTSLGSRGLSAAPLAAELLVSQLLGTLPPAPRYLQRAIAPARFAERALKRGNPL
ncbi:bifunctional tRNA (5-methylaminomethyl-2-thiouridine)(34)-methyltransferase MnmD/FAD-dependent 5-carboxymethylaminomethyl-2-thiouridine(34) oxidoreductase MnmC [Luminiphilus sp.]|nr:bifunctional tRNA (5-methylaminomethyl-2-thiouridine)(34)-methyltransferase MnmD/FAD-dependent 5-carboxymethylaminomethyl-2-thiouridine(34) oxidoreductase MnmC [Luminiphilus sp.]MDA9667056.1 bifunctional tRNA (5-methylaminomethyl-2-thiouridine)(34)-methyltransferase MnmD/FAD-dependent 5-carboxymethylaminomethyl-2-thiouridine(34) oxidoreductase MnmC [Luminiphilus sp.]